MTADHGGVRGRPRLVRLQSLLAGRANLWLALGLGLLAVAPSLRLGFLLDDYSFAKFILNQLHGKHTGRAWWDLFDTCGRMREWDQLLRVGFGLLPWWSAPDLSIAFFRPLAVATHYLDFALWPTLPLLMHAQNMLWYALLLVIAAALYRAWLSPAYVAGLALLLYAVDETHADGADWIAGRNTLMTACFVLLALLLHDRFRARGRLRFLLLSLASLLLAHASSEGAIATFAYLVPYALLLDHGPLRARLGWLLPAALLSTAWQVVYRKLGYGVYGSGVYIDPLDDPAYFLHALPRRLSTILRDQFTFPSIAFDALPRPWPAVLEACAAAVFALFLFATWRALRDRPRLWFWIAATLASAIPICAIDSAPRLFFVLSFGAFGWIAEVVAHAWSLPRPRRAGAGLLLLAASSMLLLHGPIAFAAAPLSAYRYAEYDDLVRSTSDSLPWGAALEGKFMFVLNTPNYMVTALAPAYLGDPGPEAFHVLGSTRAQVLLSRPRFDTIVFQTADGYLREPWSQLVRRPELRFEPGYRVPLAGGWLEVQQVTPDGRPRRIALWLPPGLDDPRYVWIAWNGAHDRYERVTPPAVGTTLALPPDSTWREAFSSAARKRHP